MRFALVWAIVVSMISPMKSRRTLALENLALGQQVILLKRSDKRAKHVFSEASYYLWRSRFGGMSVSEAKRLKELEAENTQLKKLLAESMLQKEVTREALRKKW